MMRRITLAVFVVALVSGCGSDDPMKSDTTAPGRVGDLQVTTVTSSSVELAWTAPGDDGANGTARTYDIRYATSTITDASFSSALRPASVPVPAAPGTGQAFTVIGLSPDTPYDFAIRTADEIPNWSALSNVVRARTQPADRTPPAAISDLTATPLDSTSVELSWTAPGDDGTTGTAREYDLRYSQSALTASSWTAATLVADLPAPAPGGTAQHMTVAGLRPGTDYNFGLKTADEEGNWSALSNVPYLQMPPGQMPSVQQLTFEAAGAHDPAWSPDGTKIAYSARQSGNGDIYVVPAEGGTPVQITATDETESDPAWARSRFAVGTSRRQHGYPDCVSLVPEEGGRPLAIYPLRWLATGARLYQPCWAPDGQHFAFASDRLGTGLRIYTMLANVNDDPEHVAPTDLVVDDMEPAWSRDGGKIAFASNRGSSRFVYHLWVKTLRADLVQLTAGQASDESPTWSPDGARIAFSSDRTGTRDLWVIEAMPGAAPRQLTWGAASDEDPAWSPDGTRIAFTSDRDGTWNTWILTLPSGLGQTYADHP